MIRIHEVVKEYRGSGGAFARPVRALAGVSLEVAAGESVGLIGLNGAGKSTLLRVLLGFVRPTSGEVEVAGMAPRAHAERRGVAYVPERVAIPRGWTVRGALNAYAALAGLDADADARVDHAIVRLGLEPLAGRRVSALSKGNVQRLAIAQAILAERDLMILDEPTDGLDPVWIARLRSIIREWRAEAPGRVVLVASHNLAEVEMITDRVVVLHRGEVRERLSTREAGQALEPAFLDLVARWEREEAA